MSTVRARSAPRTVCKQLEHTDNLVWIEQPIILMRTLRGEVPLEVLCQQQTVLVYCCVETITQPKVHLGAAIPVTEGALFWDGVLVRDQQPLLATPALLLRQSTKKSQLLARQRNHARCSGRPATLRNSTANHRYVAAPQAKSQTHRVQDPCPADHAHAQHLPGQPRRQQVLQQPPVES